MNGACEWCRRPAVPPMIFRTPAGSVTLCWDCGSAVLNHRRGNSDRNGDLIVAFLVVAAVALMGAWRWGFGL